MKLVQQENAWAQPHRHIYIYIYIVNSMNKALPRIREQVFMITFHDLSAHTTKWRWKGVSQKQTDI